MTIVPVEIELGVSEAIAVSLMMIHGRIETHNIKLNTQIKQNKTKQNKTKQNKTNDTVHIALELKIYSILRRDYRMLASWSPNMAGDSMIQYKCCGSNIPKS
jgi:hypothetical protein